MANTVPNIDPKIVEILSAYDESADGGAGGNLWFVQGQAVILHKCVERIAARAKIVFEEPQIIRAEREEAVILVRARLGDRSDYDIGEALVNVNYRVSGRQAAYVFAMALKRGRDRLVLKLVGLHGLAYSEVESDDFQSQSGAGLAPGTDRKAIMDEAEQKGICDTEDGRVTRADALRRK